MTCSELSQIGKLGRGVNYSITITRLEEAGVIIREDE